MSVTALVPMRHDSERVPGKNYRSMAGRPLYHYIVATLLSVPAVDQVVIDTDSDLIARDAAISFPSVRVLTRPEALRGGDVPMNEVLLHDIDLIESDLYLQTHSTNPLLSARTITAALEAFCAPQASHDSLFTVTALQTRLWTAEGAPLNHDPAVLLRTQDLPPVMEENSCLYLFEAETLRRHRSRIGESPLLFPISRLEAWDIDDEADWTVVAALLASTSGK